MNALKALFLCLLSLLLLFSKVGCFSANFKFTLDGVIYYGHADNEVVSDGSQWLKFTSVNALNSEEENHGPKIATTQLIEVYNKFKYPGNLQHTAISKSLNANLDFTIDDVTWQDVYIIQVETTQDAMRISYVLHQVFWCSFTVKKYEFSPVYAESFIGRTTKPWLKITKFGKIDDKSKYARAQIFDPSRITSNLAKKITNEVEDFCLYVDETNERVYVTLISCEELNEDAKTTIVLSYQIVSVRVTFVLGGVKYYGVAEVSKTPQQTLQVKHIYTDEVNKIKNIYIKDFWNCYEKTDKSLSDVKLAKPNTPLWGFNQDRIDWTPVTVISVIQTQFELQILYE